MALDYASIMQAGQNLVPNLQEQMFLGEQNRLLAEQRRGAIEARQMKMQAEQQAQQRQAAFQRDVAFAVQSGDPKQISALMVKYPEFADQIKPGWDAYSKEGRQQNLTQLGTAYTRAQNGDYEGAAQILERRYEADKAAGVADEETPQVIAALRSGDPMKQKTALGTLGIYLSAADPDKFGETFGKLNPTDAKTTVQKEYEWRVNNFGKESADTWLATQDEQIVTVVPGGSAFRKSDLVTGGGATAPVPQPAPAQQPRGGDPVRPEGGAIEARARQVVPGVVVTSRKRSPEKNRAVGGKPNSYHLTDQARDFTPPPGMSMAQLAAQLKQAFPGFDVINEGDHVHVEPKGSRGGQGGGPVKVRTIQEAQKLPKGTRYITPDGQEFIR